MDFKGSHYISFSSTYFLNFGFAGLCLISSAVRMLLAIAISVIYLELQDWVLRKDIDAFFKNFWTQWNLRLTILCSLILQLFLIMSGHIRRRYIGKFSPYLAIGVWFAYMLADWMATFCLTTLVRANALNLEPRKGLVAFWSPFLLWHLGGPYNITAYALEDNEQWLRHGFGMVIQVLQAIYVFSIYGNAVEDRFLKYVASPMLIAGFVKYGERIWALRCASDKVLVKSLYPTTTDAEVDIGGAPQLIRTGMYEYNNKWTKSMDDKIRTKGSHVTLARAYAAFSVFKPLFLDLPFELSANIRRHKVYLGESDEEEAFKMVGIELEFLYDMLFTKLPIQHGKNYLVSSALRVFCFGSAVSSLIAFSISSKPRIPNVDIAITYLLLGQVILLDLCSYVLRYWSNWIVMKLPGHKFYSMMTVFPRLRRVRSEQGIKVMAQHELMRYYVKQACRGWCSQILKVVDTNDLIQKFIYTNWRPIDRDLKKFIYSHLQAKSPPKCNENGLEFKTVSDFLQRSDDDDSWTIEATDFNSKIVIWHIATELVYYDDFDHFRIQGQGSSCKIGKALSDYMMYLVLVRPLMLPKGFNEVINKQTFNQASKFFPYEMIIKSKDIMVARKEFTTGLLSSKIDESSYMYNVTGSNIEDILFQGLRFAKQLQLLAREDRWDDEDKWGLISEVWMEIMIQAASQCSWKEHAQQLRHGGELLTHVALLMAHFGLSTKIQEQKIREHNLFDV